LLYPKSRALLEWGQKPAIFSAEVRTGTKGGHEMDVTEGKLTYKVSFEVYLIYLNLNSIAFDHIFYLQSDVWNSLILYQRLFHSIYNQ
jgi:hypothetical protein